MVSWSEVLEFIRKLNQQTGKRYRLPTEAEWEYAARGGASGQNFKYAGSDNIDEAAWYKSNSGRKTQPAGSKRPNELGIYDMSGNVWEWVNDRFGDYTAAAKVNPKGAPSGSSRVFRGGGWYDSAKMCRTSYLGKYDLLYPFYIGIRLAMDP
jgi:formylglycine-generating enzyme required for sulfatase activity